MFEVVSFILQRKFEVGFCQSSRFAASSRAFIYSESFSQGEKLKTILASIGDM